MSYFNTTRSFKQSIITSYSQFNSILKNQKFNLHYQPSFSRPYTNYISSKSTSSFNDEKKNYLYFTTKLFLCGGAVYLSCDIFRALWAHYLNEHFVNITLEKGTQPKVGIPNDKLIFRSKIIENLKKLFQLNELDNKLSYYNMICGEHGTGKTTLIKIAAKEVGKGIIYVDTPEDFKELGNRFGKALNFTFEEDVSILARLKQKYFDKITDNSNSKLGRVTKAFTHAATVYKEKHGTPPIIIYDNINNKYSELDIISIFHDDTKNNTNDKNHITVFVNNEEKVYQKIKSFNNSWSYELKPVMEISDLSKGESIDYLVSKYTEKELKDSKKRSLESKKLRDILEESKRKISHEDAEKLFELVGGRIVELQAVASRFLCGQSIEDIKQQILDEVKKEFEIAQLLKDQSHHKVGKKIINSLLNSKEISYETYTNFFSKATESDKLLESNIFTHHPEKNTVTFQSRSIEYYIQENIDMFSRKPIMYIF